MKKSIFLIAFCLFVASSAWAQRTVKGKVTGSDGLGLPGVSVIEKANKSNGVSTDIDGNWTLILPNENSILVFSSVGMKNVELVAKNAKIVKMEEDVVDLDGVVVTAMGMTRDKKSVGFSVQELNSEDINKVVQTDAVSALSGKVSGVQISSGSAMSGSNRILLRGANSICGENQPLFIIDGVPMDNSNYNTIYAQEGNGGVDYGNMLNDLNQEDIANISVLKGAAAALYGSRAANGVVMITTKNAKSGKDHLSVDISSGVAFESIHQLPYLQTRYGGGDIYTGEGAEDGFQLVTIKEEGKLPKKYKVPIYRTDESWGPRYNPSIKYLPWYAFDKDDTKNYLKEQPWVSPKHDVKDFFETGIALTNSISVAKSGKKYGLKFGYTNMNLTGTMPNSKQNKNNISFRGNTKILDKIKISAGINFSRQNSIGRPTFGYDGNSVSQQFFQWGQRQLDFKALKDNYKSKLGVQKSWNRMSYNNPTPEYSDNPYWTVYENYNDDERDRFFGNISLNYEIIDGMNIKGSAYGDTYTFYNRERTAVGSQDQSEFSESVRKNSEYNYELILNYIKDLTDDLNLSAMVGGNMRDYKYYFNRVETNGGLAIKNLWDLNNSRQAVTQYDYKKRKKVNSLFASTSLAYKSMLFLDLTARNDWSSALPNNHNSFFYPSASLSFLFSELLRDKVNWVNFGKLRLGWSQVGNDTEPYRVSRSFLFNSDGSFNGSTRLHSDRNTDIDESFINNIELKPEKTTSIEAGIDFRFFQNRFGLSFTWYKNNTINQIIPLEISKTTGYSNRYTNAGEMQNIGIEVTLNASVIKTNDFSWDVAVNYSHNQNKLLSLYGDIDKLQIASAPFRNVYLMAKVGESYGQLVGRDFVYDKKGNKAIVNRGSDEIPNYQYGKTKELQNLGSVLPDFNMGIRNSFRYKNIDIGCLFDIQKGGKFFSVSHMWGMYSGMLEATAGLNDKGLDIRSPTDIGGGVKLIGVKAEADEDGYVEKITEEFNDKYTEGKQWAQGFYSNKIGSQNIFDADYIKLRELTIGYTVPNFKLGPFSKLNFSVYGKNLLTLGLDKEGFDPETTVGGSGNIQGIEGGFIPNTRRYGVSIKLGF